MLVKQAYLAQNAVNVFFFWAILICEQKDLGGLYNENENKSEGRFPAMGVYRSSRRERSPGGGGGGTLGISGWGCAAGTLEPLDYTRASSAEFCYPILE